MLNITVSLPTELLHTIIDGIMENQPDYSADCVLQCNSWKYKDRRYQFYDHETQKTYVIGESELIKGVARMLNGEWPAGCTSLPSFGSVTDPEAWADWLCQADAVDADAFVQLCILGEVIYG